MATPYSGRDSRVQVEAINLTADSWTVTRTATDIDSYNFESLGYDEGTFGRDAAELRVSGFWDKDQSPLADPPNLVPGQYISGVKVYISKTDDVLWDFTTMRCISFTTSCEADGRVNIEFTAKSHGSFSSAA